jgi:hypothetical protein
MCLPAEIKQLMESSSLENYGYQIIHMCLLSLSLSSLLLIESTYLFIDMSINLLLLCCPETLSSTSKDNCTEIQEEGMMFKGSL